MSTSSQPPLVDMAYHPNVETGRARILHLLQRDGTPVFLCERDNLADRYRALDQSLETHWGKHIIAYSFKTNYLVAKLRILQELGAWAEVVSGREYQLARQLKFPGPSIVFNGPLKPDDSLRTAIADGALISINDHDELDRLIAITSDRTTPIDIGIRISSTLPCLGHSRFGFSLENTEASSAVSGMMTEFSIGARYISSTSIDTPRFSSPETSSLWCFLCLSHLCRNPSSSTKRRDSLSA